MKTSHFVNVKNVLAGIIIVIAFSGGALAATQGRSIAKVTIPPTPEQYATSPQALTPTQCAQCHTNPFQSLKDNGGKHRFSCQDCHNLFHAYNPRKGNWDAIMPKCSTCHEAPHGPKISECGACHTNPHSPKKIAATTQLINFCFDCHGTVREQLVKYPSKHTNVTCSTCHTSHGFKPSCFTCHKPHTDGQALATCLQCHPVHQPRQIIFSKDVPSSTCGGCHAKILNKLAKNTSKHHTLTCVTCHKDKHRFIPQCTDCHGKPHKQAFHDKFPRCLTCHIDVHDLPNMSSSAMKK